MPTEGRWKAQTDRERLEALLVKGVSNSTSAFRHTVFEKDIEWTTTVVYSQTEEGDWVGIRTDRESAQPQIYLPTAKKPLLVRTILDNLGGGLDGELYANDEPFYLKPNDAGMATRLINGDADNYLPIVYISSRFDMRHEIDPIPLARSLGGMAHVLVEPDRAFSRMIQKDVGSRNAYGGGVGIYWPNGERYYYSLNADAPTEFDLRRQIAARIRGALLNRRPLARCTWARAEAEIARKVFEHLQSSGSDDVEEYVAVFDSELKAKDKQLLEAEDEIRRLKYRLKANDRETPTNQVGFPTSGEQELFPGEIGEILKEALDRSAASSQPGSRRQHVLASISDTIPDSTILKDKREEIKSILRDYTSLDSKTRQFLESAGFSISEDGKHYKLTYMQDDRYVFSLSKTGSDHRAGLNMASDISKRIY